MAPGVVGKVLPPKVPLPSYAPAMTNWPVPSVAMALANSLPVVPYGCFHSVSPPPPLPRYVQ